MLPSPKVSVPFPLRHAPYRGGFDKVVLWYGRSNVSPLHFDPNHNYMHQLDGQKLTPSQASAVLHHLRRLEMRSA